MNTVDRKREAIKAVYPSPAWADKVKKMPDTQVAAVFLRLQRQNKI